MSCYVFTPPPDKPLRMVGRHDNCYRLHPEVEREKKCLAPVERRKKVREKKKRGPSHESPEECTLHSGIIQTARYSVLSRFAVYLLKLL